MIGRLFNLVLIILLAPALYAFAYQGALFVVAVSTWDAFLWFLGGIVLSLFVYVPFLSGKIGFIEHLLHEFEHAALAFLVTFKLPTKMEIDPQEGSEVVAPKGGGCVRALAPYYLPLLTLPFLLGKALISLALSWLQLPFPPSLAGVLDGLIGATWIFHSVCTLKEFHLKQTDITKTGVIASFIAVLFMNFMFVVLIVAVVTGAYAEFWDYLKASLPAAVDAYQAVLDFAQTRVLPMVSDWIQTLQDQFCLQCTPTPTPMP
jgi:hypothetical protein